MLLNRQEAFEYLRAKLRVKMILYKVKTTKPWYKSEVLRNTGTRQIYGSDALALLAHTRGNRPVQ